MTQRNTVQKNIIFSALHEMCNHPTADQVYDYIHSEYPNISRATVFRVLRQLAENKQILRVATFDSADCFDHNTIPHCHARCVSCHKLFDVFCKLPSVSDFSGCTDKEFAVTGYSLLLVGQCSECQMKAENLKNEQPMS